MRSRLAKLIYVGIYVLGIFSIPIQYRSSLLRPALPTRRQTIAEDREKLRAKNPAALAIRGGNVIVLLGSRRKVSHHLVCPFSRVTPVNEKFVKGREAWEERREEGCNFRPAT